MKHKQFTVYDQKAHAYLPPFVLPQIEMAKRIFSDCVNSQDHQFAKHPEDYTLFCLGDWDDETAQFVPEPNGPHPLGNGVEFVIEPTPDTTNGQIPPISNEAPILESTPSDDTSE